MAAERLVLDASVALRLAAAGRFDLLEEWSLLAPHLILSEVRSAFQQMVHHRQVPLDVARAAYARLRDAPLEVLEEPRRYEHDDAWDVSVRLGWAKTYDAEYLGIAYAAGIPICTLDKRMQSGARRLGIELVRPG